MDDMEQNLGTELSSDSTDISELISAPEPGPTEVSLEEPVVAEAEEDVVEDPIKKPKPKPDALHRIKQLSREKYHAEYVAKTKEEENEKLRNEVERLRVLSEQNSQAAMSHFDDSVKRQMDQARFRMTKAIQEGDVEEQLKATEDLAEAKAKQLQIDSWNANQNYEKQRTTHEVKTVEKPYIEPKTVELPPEQPELTHEANEWLRNNSWFNPKSYDFDEGLAKEVQAYEALLFSKYQRAGKEDKILSQEYFDEIDRYISEDIYGQEVLPVKPQPVQRTLNMTSNRAPVAPVSRSRPAAQNTAPRITLPEGMSVNELKGFIENLGVTQAQFVEHVKEDALKQQAKQRQLILQGKL